MVKTKPKTTASKTRKALDAVITVRMYRQGLGDCFLLSFPREGGGKPFYMLIDCGVILGTDNQTDIMRAVVTDIAATTDGQLDLLVATHEHWDHLSAFVQAQDLFMKLIKVEAVWLAWTEDPDNKLGQKLRSGRKLALAALRKTAMRLEASNSASAPALRQVLEFFGDIRKDSDRVGHGAAAGPPPALGVKGGGTTEDALGFIRTLVDKPIYRHPGEGPVELPGVEGVRVYVLGPPEDETLIRKSDPTKEGREVYELAMDSEFENAFISAAQFADLRDEQLTDGQRRDRELSLPFDDWHGIPIRQATQEPFFQTRYGFSVTDDKLAWRHIDEDWLEASGSLALKLDSDTNNTSLAMAIEFDSPSGERNVMLFPGDAQVGNWLSWETLRWPKEAKKDDANAVTHRRLLERTVLYKVGHHASHNATLRENGLELMTHRELVAMIPVDERVAREKKKWNMPFPSLFKRLQEKTHGRFLRADESLAALKDRKKSDSLTNAEWSGFISRLSSDPDDTLYIEYRIPIDRSS
jgi:hypothetical protein